MELLLLGVRATSGVAARRIGERPTAVDHGRRHMLHAVGLAWAERYRGVDRMALTLFGDGATSEGDFHEAMNFAAVYRRRCVFVCQNNRYAISLPREQQTRLQAIADKAVGYGMPGVQVDGNDVFAVYQATSEAVRRARAGDGPTLIEAVTYRVGPHSSADDPGRYRSAELTEQWRQRDPIERLRRYLAGNERWRHRLAGRASSARPRPRSSAPWRPRRRYRRTTQARSSTRCSRS